MVSSEAVTTMPSFKDAFMHQTMQIRHCFSYFTGSGSIKTKLACCAILFQDERQRHLMDCNAALSSYCAPCVCCLFLCYEWPDIGPNNHCRWGQIKNGALGDEGHMWERFFRSLFWFGVIMAAVSMLQWLLLLLFAQRRWRAPIMAVFPRPQLFVVLMGLPALIQAAARKLRSCC